MDERILEQNYKDRGYLFAFPTKPIPLDSEHSQTEPRPHLLVMTHQLSRTGAPLALFTMVKILLKYSKITVLSVEDGPLKQDYLNLGACVVIAGRYWERRVVFKSFATKFSGVIANTVLHFPAIMILDGCHIPVIWWIHEHEGYFAYGRGEIPNPNHLSNNIHIYAAGEYVAEVLKQEFKYNATVLHVGIACPTPLPSVSSSRKASLHFICVGTYGWEKGQDVLTAAYRMLSSADQNRLTLTFIGDEQTADRQIYTDVKALANENQQISMLPLMPHEQVMNLYQKADGVVISSRREVLSMVGLENMMLGKCVIASTASGNAALLAPGRNGYVFPTEQPDALADCLHHCLLHTEALEPIGQAAQSTFLEQFTLKQFERRIREEIVTLLNK